MPIIGLPPPLGSRSLNILLEFKSLAALQHVRNRLLGLRSCLATASSHTSIDRDRPEASINTSTAWLGRRGSKLAHGKHGTSDDQGGD